jgi:molybdopterin/thiamine biosynthesis adenylyltransferase
MERVIVIGLGGIGGFVTEPLCRFLNYGDSVKEVVLVDGDIYEAGNASRQNAVPGMNKADAWSHRMSKMFPQLKIRSVAEFVTPENVASVIADKSHVLMCVDNHATRLLVQERCERLKNVVLISGGNEYFDGNVQVFAKRNGRASGPPISKHHPEILNPSDRRPDEIGCDEEAESKPQLLFANLMAASLMLNAFYNACRKAIDCSEVYFDLQKNTAKAVKRAA